MEAGIPVKQSRKLQHLHHAQAMLRQIRQTAQADGESLLTYLVEMAYLEASDRIRAIWHATRADSGGGRTGEDNGPPI
ncbi:MAG: hypothetical protein E5W41_00730 [Mesorhizobium sp.]|nr:MAG: hypothetical protein E5W41_00730 [Mesorhizobium sp.]